CRSRAFHSGTHGRWLARHGCPAKAQTLQDVALNSSSVRCFVPILAATLLLAACTRDPKVLKTRYLEAGDRYFAKQKYREASIMYRTALKKDPRFGVAYYHNALA